MRKKHLAIDIESKSGKRETYRAGFSDLQARIGESSTAYVVENLSPTGIGVQGSIGLPVDRVALVHLYRKGKPIVLNLKARVARVSVESSGLFFENLSRRQTDDVHSIVLEAQKRQVKRQSRVRLDTEC